MAEQDNAALAAWEAERAAKAAAAAGFDATEDRAFLVALLFEGCRNEHSDAHDHPRVGPILERAKERYRVARRHDMRLADRIAQVEAVRAVLALTDEEIAAASDKED